MVVGGKLLQRIQLKVLGLLTGQLYFLLRLGKSPDSRNSLKTTAKRKKSKHTFNDLGFFFSLHESVCQRLSLV